MAVELTTWLTLVTIAVAAVCSQPAALPSTTTLDSQLRVMEETGYDVNRLEDSGELRSFFDGWLAEEREGMGKCIIDFSKLPPIGKRGESDLNRRSIVCMRLRCPSNPSVQRGFCRKETWCCPGWKPVMEICTRERWYEDSNSIKATMKKIQDAMWFCPEDTTMREALD